MGNAKTPTGDSKTNKLTAEQARERISKSEPAMLTAARQEDLKQIVEVDVIVMEPAARDKTMTKLEDKSPDAIKPIVAGRKGEVTEVVYENGQKLVPETREPNESLQRAQTRIDTVNSSTEKYEAEQSGDEINDSGELGDNGQRPEDR